MRAGRVVAVTGGGSGLGAAIASAVTDAGAAVVTVEGSFDSRAGADRAFAAAVGDEPLHAVVHAQVEPAALVPGALAETDPGGWDARCEAVLRAALWCCQAAYRLLAARGGRVVLLTPTVGLTGRAELVPYATAVEGIRALAKSAARQWGDRGITVNCVAPPVELLIERDGAAEPPVGGWALGRAPDASDVASAVALLLAAPARFVTGATIAVDGGVVMAP